MKKLLLGSFSVAAIILLAAVLATPCPAGACSCGEPDAFLEFTEVRLVSVGEGVVDETQAIADETELWPNAAAFDGWSLAAIDTNGGWLEIILEVGGPQ